jgi:cation diffusion facilitator family transporter
MPHGSRRVPVAVYGALAANFGIAVAKFAAAAITGSSALLSEGIHSVADTGNELLLLLGISRSRKPADATHPYGYGKELYFWSLIVSIILFALGGGASIYEGVEHMIHPEPLRPATWSFVVLGMALVFESASLTLALRELRSEPGPASVWRAVRSSKDPTVYMIVGEDVAAVTGVIVAAIGVALGSRFAEPLFDAAASIVVGCILSAVAILLARESRDLLVGESGGGALVEDVRRIAELDDAVERVGRPLTMQLGPNEVLVNLTVEFSSDLPKADLAVALERIESAIQRAHPEVTRIFVKSTFSKRPRVFPR